MATLPLYVRGCWEFLLFLNLFYFDDFLFFQPLQIPLRRPILALEGDSVAPFSVATTLRCRKGATSFHGLLHFTLDTYLIMTSFR